MVRIMISAFFFFSGSKAMAEVILACTFPSIPAVVMRFPDDIEAQKTMEVASRPAVPLLEGQGSGRLISATVDGYDFQFAPVNSVMDVSRDGALVISEPGTCATIGGPVNDRSLTIAGAQPTPDEFNADEPTSEAVVPIPDATTHTAEDFGRWTVKEDKSAFDDSATVVLTLNSTEMVRGQFGAPGPATIFLRCKENTTVLYVWMNELFLSDIQGFGEVDYRIDNMKAATIRMESSTDNKSLGLWNGDRAIPMINKLLAAEKVVFRATPYNESPVEFSFDLAGIESAILPLRKACSW
jgi:hypothetical protein